MTDRRETVEKQPARTTMYRERESSSTGILIGVVVALLVIAVVAFMFLRNPATEPTAGDTSVTVETPAPSSESSAEPPPPAPEAPAAAAPAEPSAPAPSEPATQEPAAPAPETTAPDASGTATPEPAPAQ